jgi:ATP-binding cassette, subfamily A (ABC1), member 3
MAPQTARQSISQPRAPCLVFGPAQIEEMPDSLKMQVREGTCISIRSLSRHFDTTNGRKVAVDSLDLDIHSGQITALLGHNGGTCSVVAG